MNSSVSLGSQACPMHGIADKRNRSTIPMPVSGYRPGKYLFHIKMLSFIILHINPTYEILPQYVPGKEK